MFIMKIVPLKEILTTQMKNEEYIRLWLIFVNIKPKKGYDFSDLIDNEEIQTEKFVGAWANIIVKADTVNDVLTIVPLGLLELGFEVEFIDKIENFMSLIDNNELEEDVIKDGQWLLQSNFVFKVSDRLFPYL